MSKHKRSLFAVTRLWISELIDLWVLWWYSRLFALMIAIFLSFSKRQRMSHNNGIGGQGYLKVVENPEFPAHDFFKPGAIFPVRIRHASATFLDDAMNCIRSISIKFSHNRFKSPFDLEMNTGETSLFWNAVSFLQFGKLRQEKWGVEYVEYNRLYPEGLQGAKNAVRRHPTSFHNLHYYSKTPLLFIGVDKIKRYAKYRIIPANNEKETGIEHNLVDWDVSNQRVLANDTRGRNWLKYEYDARVKKQGASYRLQIQTRRASDDEDPEIFNNMRPWDENIFPWHDVAQFTIDKILDWRESTLTAFSLNNLPKSLGVIPAKSIYDYNSLNYMRKHSEIARHARVLALKIFGMVPPIPDNDNRNAEDWGV
jgi:hypothetical protein